MADEERRGPGRPKGSKASAKQRATAPQAREASARARAARKAERQQSKEIEKPRWKQLEDGDITPRDLTEKELVRHECANNDGSWEGRRHAFSPRIQQRMDAEFTRRMRTGLGRMGKPASRALRARLDDDDNPAQQLAASIFVYNHLIGKPPDVVHIGAETEFDRMKQSAFVILRGEENVAPDTDDDGHQVIAGEAEWKDDDGHQAEG